MKRTGSSSSKCTDCGNKQPWVLHHVRRHRFDRELCTSCVLKQHLSQFCPVCFEVYDQNSLPSHRIQCSRCPSITHSSCITRDSSTATGPASHVCPSCSNPHHVFFDIKSKGGEIDLNMAKVLLAAAQISANSMHSAVRMMTAEVEKKVREAATAKKKAREALEIVMLGNMGKERRAENSDRSVVVRNGLAASAVGIQNRVDNQFAAGNNGNSEVIRVQTVHTGLREQRLSGFQMPRVEDRNRMGRFSSMPVGRQLYQDLVTVNQKMDSHLPPAENNAVEGPLQNLQITGTSVSRDEPVTKSFKGVSQAGSSKIMR